MNILLLKRLDSNKSKWTAIAGTQANCLRNGEVAFANAGFPSQWIQGYKIAWSDQVEVQKNYIGKCPLFKEV